MPNYEIKPTDGRDSTIINGVDDCSIKRYIADNYINAVCTEWMPCHLGTEIMRVWSTADQMGRGRPPVWEIIKLHPN